MSQEKVEIVRWAISFLNERGEPDWDLCDPGLI
jgi:hypothetical protein